MKAFFAKEQQAHDPQHFMANGTISRSPEQPERAERLARGAEAAGLSLHRPGSPDRGAIAAIHAPEYLAFLKTAHERWQHQPNASAEVIPNVHPASRQGSYPASVTGQAGWHMADTACPIGPHTFEAATWAAATALAAAETVLGGERAAYALCRPPGHHAFADMAGGFCFLNNSAIAAQRLRDVHPRVAILDVDVHHGNGTQGIFYARSDVLTVSLHADPVRYYPFFWGHAAERGEGPGLGYNLNVPLPRFSEDDAYLTALAEASERIEAFAPGALVVALGLDAHRDDPLKGLSLTTGGFERMGRAIAGLGLPSVIVQEGGYLCDPFQDNLTAFLAGFQSGLG